MRWVSPRTVITSVLALLLALALFGLGVVLAPAWVAWVASQLGLDRLIVTSPLDAWWMRVKLGATFATPAILAWVAMVIHRVRASVDPSSFALVSYVLVPAVAVAAAASRELLALSLANVPSGVEPVVNVADLAPTSCLTYSLLAGVVLCVVVAVRARPHAPRAPA